MLKTIAGLLLTMVCGVALAQENVPQIPDQQMENPATCLRTLREAALADDTGKKLENTLAELNLLPGAKL